MLLYIQYLKQTKKERIHGLYHEERRQLFVQEYQLTGANLVCICNDGRVFRIPRILLLHMASHL